MRLNTYLWLVWVTLLLLAGVAQAQPELSEAQATKLIKQSMQHERLYWLPFPLPYSVPQSSKSKDARLLAALEKHGLVSRARQEIEVAQQDGKPQYELQWEYNYQPLRKHYEKEGFYYGKPKLLNIRNKSDTISTNAGLFVLVEIEWMVADLQSWTQDPAFHIARTLRRSQKSASQPFEEKIHFEYLPNKDRWQIWEPDNG